MKLLQWIVLALGLALAPVPAMPASHSAADKLTNGEVSKVDTDAGKITIRHGPIENLGMPAMTMVYQAGDRALLSRVKAGDRIRFRAEKAGGVYRVTHIEKAE